jgi:hypothetical protein
MAIIEDHVCESEAEDERQAWDSVVQDIASGESQNQQAMQDMEQIIREKYMPAKLAEVSSHVAHSSKAHEKPSQEQEHEQEYAGHSVLVCSTCEGQGKVRRYLLH